MSQKLMIDKITIIICTYNRFYILEDCLNSLVSQNTDPKKFDVIVVNNNSTDQTQEIVEKFSSKYSNFRVYIEYNQGLSHARNRGIKEATTEWIAYVDDDATANPDFVEQSLFTINNYSFDFFGGVYYPWYRNVQKPKWIDTSFGQSIIHSNKITKLENGFIDGGVSVYKKEILESIGFFPTNLGMNGNKIAYGEETFVQIQLTNRGFIVGYNPFLQIKHLVPSYKLSLSWQIKSAYAVGRDSIKIFNNNEKVSIFIFIYNIFKLLAKNVLLSSKKVIFLKNYYIQNYILDILVPIANYVGYFRGIKSKK